MSATSPRDDAAAGPARQDKPRALPVTGQPDATGRHASRPAELGGPAGPEPTRYGDWEKNGRCIDF
ncbi:MAG: DUF1674 domain-containing protein [Gammaproteobacteria bacterium]|nr:DUF1674 domain-containing protein [Gammaproteobacteria bacterium]